MELSDVRDFFGKLASSWDEGTVRDERVIETILDNAGVSTGSEVLDVACGTGVLIPDYLKRGASSVTAIDITPEMADIAKEKFPQDSVEVICGDAVEYEFGREFDCAVVYNALPHFNDPERLVYRMARTLKKGGFLTIAHGMSRERINAHHHNVMNVSRHLMPAEELAEIFGRYLTVTTVISNDDMYQVAGRLDMEHAALDAVYDKTLNEIKAGNRTMHEHEHDLEHDHLHEHVHEHSHEHGHTHTHEGITAFDSVEQAVKVLGYMLDHNRSHAEELHEICHKLEATGEAEAAEYLDKAVDAFRQGNDLMDEALRILGKEEE